jgi:hypothetical protein
MSPAPTRPITRPITRADLESKFREIQGGADVGPSAPKGVGIAAIVGAAVVAVVIAYLVGRRKGRKRRTFVEVRRV